eukprot:10693295-Lingulodinium_polyedra.AAC.1
MADELNEVKKKFSAVETLLASMPPVNEILAPLQHVHVQKDRECDDILHDRDEPADDYFTS